MVRDKRLTKAINVICHISSRYEIQICCHSARTFIERHIKLVEFVLVHYALTPFFTIWAA